MFDLLSIFTFSFFLLPATRVCMSKNVDYEWSFKSWNSQWKIRRFFISSDSLMNRVADTGEMIYLLRVCIYVVILWFCDFNDDDVSLTRFDNKTEYFSFFWWVARSLSHRNNHATIDHRYQLYYKSFTVVFKLITFTYTRLDPIRTNPSCGVVWCGLCSYCSVDVTIRMCVCLSHSQNPRERERRGEMDIIVFLYRWRRSRLS